MFFGVIGMIYEVCLNVMVDVIGLVLKSGNVIVLKGGFLVILFN